MPLLFLSERLLVPCMKRNFPLALGGEPCPLSCLGRLPLWWCRPPPFMTLAGRGGPAPLLTRLISSSSRRPLYLISFLPFFSFSLSGTGGGATGGIIIWRGREGLVPLAVPYREEVERADLIVPE